VKLKKVTVKVKYLDHEQISVTLCDSTADRYRFGFNGMEKDNELKGIGNSLDFGARMYDSRLGRFLSLDPLSKDYPSESNYMFAGNSPIALIDYNGEFKISPDIKENYPHIYTYLSTQIAKDVEKSTLIKQSYKEINPNVTDANIRNIFKDNSGPVLEAQKYVGGVATSSDRAVGYTEYSETKGVDSRIQINEKVLGYVEGVLKSDANKETKMVAQMFLYTLVLHEVAHEISGYNGVDERGRDIKLTNKERKQIENGEGGYHFDNKVWGYGYNDTWKEFLKDVDNVIDGLDYGNPTNKKGVMENVIKHANRSDNTKQALPTVIN
jgi:RHS repeat-associated protein